MLITNKLSAKWDDLKTGLSGTQENLYKTGALSVINVTKSVLISSTSRAFCHVRLLSSIVDVTHTSVSFSVLSAALYSFVRSIKSDIKNKQAS